MKSEQKTSRAMNIILWIAQVILAVSFLWGSAMKLFLTADKLAEMWAWTSMNAGLVKFTGILDLLAGIGIFLPSALRIYPKMTIYAAYGIVLLMIAASIFHISRGEESQIGVNIFLGFFAAFIAWGRMKKVPIFSRVSN